MTAKEYLSQARTLDMRIKSKLQQIESLNGMDCRHGFLLQLNQIIHISFQAFLDLDYFYDSGFHLGAAMIRVTWHIAVNNGARCGQFV